MSRQSRDQNSTDLAVLLVIELTEPDEWRRKQFHAALVERSWFRFSDHSNTWCAGFECPVTETQALTKAQRDLREAAAHAGIQKWNAVLQASPWAPVTCSSGAREN